MLWVTMTQERVEMQAICKVQKYIGDEQAIAHENVSSDENKIPSLKLQLEDSS